MGSPLFTTSKSFKKNCEEGSRFVDPYILYGFINLSKEKWVNIMLFPFRIMSKLQFIFVVYSLGCLFDWCRRKPLIQTAFCDQVPSGWSNKGVNDAIAPENGKILLATMRPTWKIFALLPQLTTYWVFFRRLIKSGRKGF